MESKKHAVLYVDYIENNLKEFINAFNKEFNIIICNSFKEGLEILSKKDICLIVLDQQILEITGIEFLKEVKIKYPEIKSILLTTSTNIQILEKNINSINLCSFITKPYDSIDLKIAMNNAIETYQLKIDKDKLNRELKFRIDKLEKMMDTAMDAIITINDNHEIIEVNKAALKMFGYKLKELKGNPLNILIPKNKNIVHAKHIKSFSKDKITKRTMGHGSTLFGITSNGEKIPIEVSLSKQKIKDGYLFNAFIRDISNRLRSEKNLKDSEYKLQEAQQIAQIGHWNLDIVNNILSWSDETYRIFELDPQQVEPTYKGFLDNIHPNDKEMVNKAYTNSLKTQKPYDITHRLKLKNGTVKHVNEKCKTVFDKHGKPLHSVGIIQDVTTRIKAETRLIKLNTAIDNSINEVYIFDAKSLVFSYYNKGAIKNLGYTYEELKTMSPIDIKPEYTYDSFTKIIEPLKNGVVDKLQFKTIHQRKDKTTYPVKVNLSTFFINNNLHFLALIIDRTKLELEEQKRLKEIEVNNHFLQKSQSIALLGYYTYDFNTKYWNASKSILDLMGLTSGKGNLKSWIKIIHKEDKSLLINVLNQRLKDSTIPLDLIYRVIRPKDGKVRWIHHIEEKIIKKDTKGVLMPAMGIIQDVTNQKLIEQELLKTKEEIEESEKRFRELYEKSGDAILIIKNGIFIECNKATVDMLEYKTKEDFLNTPPAQLSPKLQPDGMKSIEKAEKMIEISLKNGTHRFEWMHIKNNGEIIPVEVLLTAISNKPNNKVIHCVWRDISVRLRAEKNIKELNKNLEKIVKERTQELTQEKNFSEVIINTLPGIFSLMEKDGTRIRWNKNHEEATGYSQQVYKNTNAFEFFSESDVKLIKKAISQLRKKDEINIEVNLVTKNKQEIPYFFTLINVNINNKKYIAGIGIDISERKLAEAELRKQTEELAVFNEVMINREMRIIEIKEEINKLSKQFGKEPPYVEVWKESK